METTTDTESGERYGAIETADGDLVIYDRDEETAWLQCDDPTDVTA